MRFSLPVLGRLVRWPQRRLAALFTISLPPLDLRPRDINRQLTRRNTRYDLGGDVRALTRTLSRN